MGPSDAGAEVAATSCGDGTDRDAEVGRLGPDECDFFYRLGGLLSGALTRIRGRFGGDLDQYLIYLVFLLEELAAERMARSRRDGLRSGPRGLNALSISDVTGIPRESARRKLLLLVEAGYLRREGDGLYYIGDRHPVDQFFLDLSPVLPDGLRSPGAGST